MPAMINISNYSVIENHRTHRKRGCLFVCPSWFYFLERVDLSLFNDTVESVFVEITAPCGNVSVVVGVIYRPPNGDISQFNDYLYDTLYKVFREREKMVRSWRFQFRYIKWGLFKLFAHLIFLWVFASHNYTYPCLKQFIYFMW